MNQKDLILKCEPNSLMKGSSILLRLIRHLYFLTISGNEKDCEEIKHKLKTVYFIYYSFIILLILFGIVLLLSICLDANFKFKKINCYPASHKAVEKLLLANYIPNKADNYVSLYETKLMNQQKNVDSNLNKQEKQDQPETKADASSSTESLSGIIIDNDSNEYSERPRFNFPAAPDEFELYMKLLLNQVTSQNRSVETSNVHRLVNFCKSNFKPRELYKKSIKFTLKYLLK